MKMGERSVPDSGWITGIYHDQSILRSIRIRPSSGANCASLTNCVLCQNKNTLRAAKRVNTRITATSQDFSYYPVARGIRGCRRNAIKWAGTIIVVVIRGNYRKCSVVSLNLECRNNNLWDEPAEEWVILLPLGTRLQLVWFSRSYDFNAFYYTIVW